MKQAKQLIVEHRNNWLHCQVVAFIFARKPLGVNYSDVIAHAQSRNAKCCYPSLTPSRVKRTAQRAWKKFGEKS